MSLKIEWIEYDTDVVSQFLSSLKSLLNNHLEHIIPSDHFIKSLYIEDLALPDTSTDATPLSITVNDITWPWPCFYQKSPCIEINNIEQRQQSLSIPSGNIYATHPSPPSTPLSNSPKYHPSLPVSSIQPASRQSSMLALPLSPQLHPNAYATTLERMNDVQLEIDVSINSPLKIRLETVVQLNQPLPSFLYLPFHIKIDHVHFAARFLLFYIGNTLGISMIKKEESGPFQFSIEMDADIGDDDSDNSNLKHVTKIQQFISEQVTDWFKRDLLFPSFYAIKVSHNK